MAVTPVTIVTGALGAGKTTLVNAALRTAQPRRIGVIVNEVGDIGLDGFLLGDGHAGLLELTSGCLCCTVRGELDVALARLARTHLDHIIIETTGIADPGPVIDAIGRRGDLLRLDAVACVADARNLAEQLADARRPEIRRQLELASTVALTKTDLVGSARTIAACERIAAINPLADLHRATRGELPLHALIGARAFAPLAAAHDHHTRHDNHDHDHDHDGHSHMHAEVETIAVRAEGDLDAERIADWLSMTLAYKGPDLNRIKGILAIEGLEQPIVMHGVHGYLEMADGPRWAPDAERLSTVVAIGHDLDEALWRQALEDCRTRPADPASSSVD